MTTIFDFLDCFSDSSFPVLVVTFIDDEENVIFSGIASDVPDKIGNMWIESVDPICGIQGAKEILTINV